MISDIVTSILSVGSTTTRNGRARYVVACGDGNERTVWEAGLANGLNAYLGQQVTLRVKEEQKGQYMNRTIEAFAPAGQSLGPAPVQNQPAPMQGVQPLGAPGAVAAAPAIQPIQPVSAGQGGGMSESAVTRITKLACLASATQLVGGIFASAGPEALGEAETAIKSLTRSFYAYSRSHENLGVTPQVTSPQGQIVPTATTPEEVAQQVPGVVVGAPVTPLAAAQQDASAEAPDVEWD